MPEFVAIITAAGKGSRMHAKCKKQFLLLQGKSILEHTIENFLSLDVFTCVVVVLPAEEFATQSKILASLYPSLEFVKGGKLRQDSIFNALDFIKSTDYVFVHDGVRPFVSEAVIRKLLDKVQTQKAVIPAVPTTNSLKQVAFDKVQMSLDRAKIFGATTPQAFSYKLLRDSYQQARSEAIEFTDDASLLEFLGHSVYWIEDVPANIKITTPFDLLVAKAILQGI